MKMIKIMAFLTIGSILFAILTSCVSTVPRGEGIVISAFDYLFNNKFESQGYGAYSYILFTRPPLQKDDDNLKYIELFKCTRSVLADRKLIKNDIERKHINVTYWPVKFKSYKKAKKHISDTTYFINQYDYDRAKLFLSKLPQLNEEGPYIVTLLNPLTSYNNVINSDEVIVVNLTGQHYNTYKGYLYLFNNQIKKDSLFTTTGRFPNIDIVRLHIKSMLINAGEFIKDPEIQKSIKFILESIKQGLEIINIFRGIR